MRVLSLLYGRRRRPTFLLLLAGVVFTFFYTSNRIYSTREGAVPGHPGEGPDDRRPEDDDIHMDYGTSSRPGFDGYGQLKKLERLPAEHLPTPDNNKRLIVVGDVHGMLAPLQALLAKVDYGAEPGRDHVVFVGDLVGEGPDSAAVVSLAQSLGASGVRGVLEDRVLLARDSGSVAPAGDEDMLEEQHLSHGDYDDRRVAEALTPGAVEYLSALPVILELGPLPTLQNAFVAHAGLVPGLDLAKQDPWPAMHMRSVVYPRETARHEKAQKKVMDEIAQSGQWKITGFLTRGATQSRIDAEYEWTRRPWDRDLVLPVDDYSGEDWARAWDEVEGRRPEADRRTVFYGHDTRAGLNVGTNAVGLNTKCVYGGQLSAFVITGGASGVEHETVQVDCEKKAELVED